MLRAFLVSILGLIFNAALVATGTFFVLRHTDFGKLMSGGWSDFSDPWQAFMTGQRVLFFCVTLPAVVVSSIFVGLLAKAYQRTVAVIVALPISVVASGFRLRSGWMSLLLLSIGVFVAVFSERICRVYV